MLFQDLSIATSKKQVWKGKWEQATLCSTDINSLLLFQARSGGGAVDQRAVPSEGSVCWGQCFWRSPVPCSDLEDTLAAACSAQWDTEMQRIPTSCTNNPRLNLEIWLLQELFPFNTVQSVTFLSCPVRDTRSFLVSTGWAAYHNISWEWWRQRGQKWPAWTQVSESTPIPLRTLFLTRTFKLTRDSAGGLGGPLESPQDPWPASSWNILKCHVASETFQPCWFVWEINHTLAVWTVESHLLTSWQKAEQRDFLHPQPASSPNSP